MSNSLFKCEAGFKNILHELALYVTGKSDKEFAERLGISEGDVKGWFEQACKNKDE